MPGSCRNISNPPGASSNAPGAVSLGRDADDGLRMRLASGRRSDPASLGLPGPPSCGQLPAQGFLFGLGFSICSRKTASVGTAAAGLDL